MPKDAAGPVSMSLARIRERIKATRRAGVHPAIYMHYTILDEGSPLFEPMKDSVLVDAAGRPALFGWEGPDVIKTTWKMSHASPQWQDHHRLLGHELYRQPSIRYLAVLGSKSWLPCAWLYKSLWPAQVDLARKVGAAVGGTNGWGDGFGLTRLPQDAQAQMLKDIASLVRG